MLFGVLLFTLSIIGQAYSAYKLVWSDEFNKDLDYCDWNFLVGTGTNGDEALYTHRDVNAKVANGSLVITAKPETYGGSLFTSARLNSQKSWTYGRFEAKAKLPKGKQLWATFWMNPVNFGYGGWAASGQIDVLGYRGDRTNQIQGGMHYGAPWPNNAYDGTGETNVTGTDFSADFHIFALEWDKNEIRWYADGKVLHKSNINYNLYTGKGDNPYKNNGAPFDQPFYVVLEISVSGTTFPEEIFGARITQAEAFAWPKPTMEIDYVRVYQDG